MWMYCQINGHIFEISPCISTCYCSDPWALYKTAKTYIHLTRCSWCNFFKFVVLYLQLWFCCSRYYCSNVPGNQL
jgi:hypothetical protein